MMVAAAHLRSGDRVRVPHASATYPLRVHLTETRLDDEDLYSWGRGTAVRFYDESSGMSIPRSMMSERCVTGLHSNWRKYDAGELLDVRQRAEPDVWTRGDR